MDVPPLLPPPQHLTLTDAVCVLPTAGLVVLRGREPWRNLAAARCVQQALHTGAGLAWSLGAAHGGGVAIELVDDPAADVPEQGYTLTVDAAGIVVRAAAPVGVWYGAQTLAQLLRWRGRVVPGLQIRDWPDLACRGVMLDVSRDRVPTMATLRALVDRLAGWKFNQLQLYTEHTFAYQAHREVWADASPLTGEDILELDAWCAERFIELVPNQNSLGHLERWLRHPRYAPLAETHSQFEAPWGPMQGPFGLAPDDPAALALIEGLYDELLPHFRSRWINVGCDEAVDLGQGRTAARVARDGVGRVYLDFVLKIDQAVRRRGRRTMLWGDIVTRHPELIAELPRDVLAIEWGYDADHPFDAALARYAAAGVPRMACCGTSTWNSLAGRTTNALENIRNAALAAQRHGAYGLLVADWGDNGHWQQLPWSYLPWAAAAAHAWAGQPARAADLPALAGRWAFGDPSGATGAIIADLGDCYRLVGSEPHNASVLALVLQECDELTPALLASLDFATPARALESLAASLARATITGPDAVLVRAECDWTIDLLRLACHLGGALQRAAPAETYATLHATLRRLIGEYRRLWLERCRPGGLPDSVAHFERLSRVLADRASIP
ncbi:MAG: beta-N-acetylhexosaminidase [Chloroflexi bacterium]|nr:beta-N-acetylhexosaminidase [Chloroflexota bacterium]